MDASTAESIPEFNPVGVTQQTSYGKINTVPTR